VATNRREALRRALTLLGAAVGIGAASNLTAVEVHEPTRKAEPEKSKELVLQARFLRINSQDLRRGELPQAGIRMTARAEIVTGSPKNQKQAGEFIATYYRVTTPGKAAAHEPGSLEQHTFILPEGTIFGTGVTTSGLESEGQFAIVGGTGRYHAARGSYVARQSHVDFGGNGTATFTFTIV
jgi:hypothetical protein